MCTEKMLNNLSAESSRINRQRLMIASLAILSLILFLFLCQFTSQELSPEEIEKQISRSEKLKQLNQFCNEIPKPEGFEFVYKKLSGNSEKVIISYQYQTGLLFPKVRDFYLDYFERNKWTRKTFWEEDESSHKGLVGYGKDKTLVSIEHVSFPDANYSLSCIQEN